MRATDGVLELAADMAMEEPGPTRKEDITLREVEEAFHRFALKHGGVTAKLKLQQFGGAAKLSDLPSEVYGQFLDTLAASGDFAPLRSSSDSEAEQPANAEIDAHIEEIHHVLKPPPENPTREQKIAAERERARLRYALQKWEEHVREQAHVPATEAERLGYMSDEEADPLMAELLGVPPEAQENCEPTAESTARRGRPPADVWPALILAVIFHEFTRKKPGRAEPNSDLGQQRARSPFYRFADASYRAIGLRVQDAALREATERWEKSRDQSKRYLKIMVFGTPKGAGKKAKTL